MMLTLMLIFHWKCDFSEMRAFLSFRIFADLITVCLEPFWSHLNDLGNLWNISEVFQSFSIVWKDLIAQSCLSSQGAVFLWISFLDDIETTSFDATGRMDVVSQQHRMQCSDAMGG